MRLVLKCSLCLALAAVGYRLYTKIQKKTSQLHCINHTHETMVLELACQPPSQTATLVLKPFANQLMPFLSDGQHSLMLRLRYADGRLATQQTLWPQHNPKRLDVVAYTPERVDVKVVYQQ